MWRLLPKLSSYALPGGTFYALRQGLMFTCTLHSTGIKDTGIKYELRTTQAICSARELTGVNFAPICVKTVLGLFQYVPCHLSLSNERGRIATAKYHKGA
jgi:hypothetical protein